MIGAYVLYMIFLVDCDKWFTSEWARIQQNIQFWVTLLDFFAGTVRQMRTAGWGHGASHDLPAKADYGVGSPLLGIISVDLYYVDYLGGIINGNHIIDKLNMLVFLGVSWAIGVMPDM